MRENETTQDIKESSKTNSDPLSSSSAPIFRCESKSARPSFRISSFKLTTDGNLTSCPVRIHRRSTVRQRRQSRRVSTLFNPWVLGSLCHSVAFNYSFALAFVTNTSPGIPRHREQPQIQRVSGQPFWRKKYCGDHNRRGGRESAFCPRVFALPFRTTEEREGGRKRGHYVDALRREDERGGREGDGPLCLHLLLTDQP